MLKDTVFELGRIARFLAIEPEPSVLQRAVALSSADRMRELEKAEQDQWIATRKRRKDIPFVRVAKAGGWRTSMPEACARKIESAWGSIMACLGYPLLGEKQPDRVLSISC
jgi:hypothetical protein